MNKKLLSAVIIMIFVLALAVGAFFLSKSEKKEEVKVYRVGILSGLDNFSSIADSFRAEMTALGYQEGKNIVYDFQKTNYEPDKDKEILAKFVKDKVDLIFGFNTEVAVEMKEATKGTNIPVVFANAFIEGNNLVKSVQEPGENITGVRYPNLDVAVKRLEVLCDLAPKAKRIWLPYQKDYPSVPSELEVVRPVAAAHGVTITEFASENLSALQAELKRRSESGDMGFDAVLLIPESLSTTKAAFEAIAGYARERKIPVGGSRIVTNDYGTLFAVTVDNKTVGILGARQADKIFNGAQAGTIPVVSPEAHIVINYKVVQELGLIVNDSLLNQAGEIIR